MKKTSREKSKTDVMEFQTFEAFPQSLFDFLEELKSNNNREWFAANRDRFDTDVVAPSLQFIQAIGPPLKKIAPSLLAIAKRQGGSLMRVYRDTRFAKDKTPYKSNVGIHLKHELGADIHAPGYYLHLDPAGCFLGAGMWMPPPEELRRVRQAILDEPTRWRKVCSARSFAECFQLDGASLKTAPRGIDPSHPEIVDLRRTSFAAIHAFDIQLLTSKDCLPTLIDSMKRSRGFMKFLCDAIAIPF